MRLVNSFALVVTFWRLLNTVAFFPGSLNTHSNTGRTLSLRINPNVLPFQNVQVNKQNIPLNSIQIPNPFSNDEQFELKVPRPPSYSTPSGLDLSPDAMFARAKAIIDSDLGLLSKSLLDDDFIYIGPTFSQNILGKVDYLAAGKFFDLRATFPDLDYRAHDFRLDANDPLTVRVTARVVGTMRGPLRLRRETVPPNGKRMICPPEAISMTFDEKSGKLLKLCAGFTMDRLVGNTDGLCGVMAAATIAGSPPSEWDLYPPVNVVQRFFGRPVRPLMEENNSFLAPFPETVMIQLTKGVIAADNGASDPDLLGSSFTFCGPLVGPIGKDDFVKAFGGFNIKGGIPDLDAQYSNFRVDPYDPYRVWVDAKGSGTRTGEFAGAKPTGLRYEGPPEAASFTFDDDGYCVRLTAGVVMDPSQGNTGGLGGVFGILYATGTPLPGVVSRSLPDLFSRLQKRISSPFTNMDVDDVSLPKKKESSVSIAPKPVSIAPPSSAPTPKPPPKVVKAKEKSETKSPAKKAPFTSSPLKLKAKLKVPKPAAIKLKTKAKVPKSSTIKLKKRGETKSPLKKLPVASFPLKVKTKANVTKPATIKSEQKPKFASIFYKRKEKSDANTDSNEKKAVTPIKLKVENKSVKMKGDREKAQAALKVKKDKLLEEAKLKKEKVQAELKAKKEMMKAKQEKAKREKAEMLVIAKEKQAAEKEKQLQVAKAKRDKENKEKQASITKAKKEKKMFIQTMKTDKPKKPQMGLKRPTPPKVAPKGIPKLTKWRRGLDKSITGNVYGAQGFNDGEQITTSLIISGEFKAGSVVETESGSRYFLE